MQPFTIEDYIVTIKTVRVREALVKKAQADLEAAEALKTAIALNCEEDVNEARKTAISRIYNAKFELNQKLRERTNNRSYMTTKLADEFLEAVETANKEFGISESASNTLWLANEDREVIGSLLTWGPEVFIEKFSEHLEL